MIVIYNNINTWSTVGIIEKSQNKDNNQLIVLLHGETGNKTGYCRSYVHFEQEAVKVGLSVFRFDLPGEGESIIYNKTIERSELIIEIIEFIRKEYGFNKINLLGHCSGGLYAMEISKKTEFVSKMVLWDMFETISNNIENKGIKIAGSNLVLKTYKKKLFMTETWKKIIYFELNIKKIMKLIIAEIISKEAYFLKNVHRKKQVYSNDQIVVSDIVRPILIIHDSTRDYFQQSVSLIDHISAQRGFVPYNKFIHYKQFSPLWQENAINLSMEYLTNKNIV